MTPVDTLIVNAAQVVTCATEGKPKRGPAMQDVGIIDGGAVAVQDGRIVAVGPTVEIRAAYTADTIIDAGGKSVIPGLVDSHTHTVYAGQRLDEFEMRIAGRSYMDIMAAGGGIMSTVRATRGATFQDLRTDALNRLDDMLRLGTTTVEIKTGYGLDDATETRMFDVIASLEDAHPARIIPTYLGPHAISPEHGTNDAAMHAYIETGLPAIQEAYARSSFNQSGTQLFVDIFCEQGVFSVDNMRAFFDAAQGHGLPLKAHVDEFVNLGGVTTAVEMGAISVDHLDVTPQSELDVLAQSDTVGVFLPAVPFNLGGTMFGDARYLIDAGGIAALATDLNPGSAPTPSLPFVMTLATRYQRLLPAEALNAATVNAAYAIGLGDLIGSLEPGKQADVVLLDVPDYRQIIYEFGMNRVTDVMIGGEVVWSAS